MTSSKFIQRIIILFWSLWFTLVSLSDITNFLQLAHILPVDFVFTSKNYDLVHQYLSLFGFNSFALSLLLFGMIVSAAILISITFWISTFTMNPVWINLAFLSSILLTMFFILCDEIFIQYTIEHGHTIRLTLLLISFMYFKEKKNHQLYI